MRYLTEDDWKLFELNSKRNGKKFESLVKDILDLHYGSNCWKETKNSWDGSKDFFWYNDIENMWAECKNYKHSIGLKVVSNSLVMAEIYDVSTLLFFSYSMINDNTKIKILKYAANEKMQVMFFDDIALENIIFLYWNNLQTTYFPNYSGTISPDLCKPVVLEKVYKNPLDYKYDNSDSIDEINLFHMFEINLFLINKNSKKITCSISFGKAKMTPLESYIIEPGAIKKGPVIIIVEPFSTLTYRIYITPSVYSPKMKLPDIIVNEECIGKNKQINKFEQKVFSCNLIDEQRLIGKKYNELVKNFLLDLKNTKDKFSILCIEGESGTGKTKLLDSCVYEALKQGKRILKFNSSYSGTSITHGVRNLIKEIIISLYDLGSDDVIGMIEKSLCDESIQLNDHIKTAYTMISEFMSAENQQEYVALVEKYTDILFEKLSSREYLLAIDNVQFFDDYSLLFLQKLIHLGINCNHPCKLNILLVVNRDYLTGNMQAVSLLNMLQDYKLTQKICGFSDKNECEEFLQETLRIGEIRNDELRTQIINKTNHNPFYLMQYIKLLNDLGLLIQKGSYYEIKDEQKVLRALEQIPDTIEKLLKQRWDNYIKNNNEAESLFLLSAIHLWEYLLEEDLKSLNIDTDIVYKLQQAGFVSINDKYHLKNFSFHHDMIEKFFIGENSTFASLAARKAIESNILLERTPCQQAFIDLHKDKVYSMEQLEAWANLIPTPKLAMEYYAILYKRLSDYIPSEKSLNEWLGVLVTYCANRRDILGSDALLSRLDSFKNLSRSFEQVKRYINYGHLMLYFSEALDSVGKYEEAYELIYNYSLQIKNDPDLISKRNFKEIMAEVYNRLHVYRRHQCVKPLEDPLVMKLIENAEMFANEINYHKFQYVNNSDRGYLYYAFPKDNQLAGEVFAYWEKACSIFESYNIPEKTLNYYRKKVQLSLLRNNSSEAAKYCTLGINYIKTGEHAYQKLLFYWWFYLAMAISYLQNNPENYFNEIDDCLNKVTQYEMLFNSSKKFYILQVIAIYLYYKGEYEHASAINKECITQLNGSSYKSKMDYLPKQLLHNQNVIDHVTVNDEVTSLVYTDDKLFNLPCL